MTDAEFEAGKANVQTGLNAGYQLGYDKGYADAKAKYEPKHGEWIPFEWDENWKEKILLPKGSDSHMEEYWAEEFVCSVCGDEHHWRKYCPNCGAKMVSSNSEIEKSKSEEANDRQCEKCRHKVETKPGVEACDVWDCSFEPKDEQS